MHGLSLNIVWRKATKLIGEMKTTQIHQYFCKRCGREFFAAEGSEAARDHLCGNACMHAFFA